VDELDVLGQTASIVIAPAPHMEWTVHYFDKRLGREAVSRTFLSESDALRHACDLERNGSVAHYVRGPDGKHILPPAIAAWSRQHKTTRRPG
jgi:hypothetical protein